MQRRRAYFQITCRWEYALIFIKKTVSYYSRTVSLRPSLSFNNGLLFFGSDASFCRSRQRQATYSTFPVYWSEGKSIELARICFSLKLFFYARVRANYIQVDVGIVYSTSPKRLRKTKRNTRTASIHVWYLCHFLRLTMQTSRQDLSFSGSLSSKDTWVSNE